MIREGFNVVIDVPTLIECEKYRPNYALNMAKSKEI